MKSPRLLVLCSFLAVACANTAPASTDAATSAGARSLAVVIRSADADSKFLAAEFSRDLIHLLGSNSGFTVAPRGQVLQQEAPDLSSAKIGCALSTQTVLAGTLQTKGETFRLEIELVDVAAEKSIWSKTLEPSLADAASVPAQIIAAMSASPARDARVPSSTSTSHFLPTNRVAWLHYLQARRAFDAFTPTSLLQAVGEFEQAIESDPDAVASRAGLATAHIALGYNFENPRIHFEKARVCVNDALRRDATLAEAIIDDGVLKCFLEWDWRGATRGAQRAVQLDPSAVETHACFLHCAECSGDVDEGLRQIAAAHAAHPGSMAIRSELGCAAYYAGKFDESISDCRAALNDDAENPFLLWGVARALAQKGEFDAAVAELEKAQSKPGGDWTGILAELAYVRARQNRASDAQALIEQLRTRAKGEYVDSYLFAMASAGLGDTGDVFRQLDSAAADRSTWVPYLPVDPKFATLRADPRFVRMLVTLKLPAR